MSEGQRSELLGADALSPCIEAPVLIADRAFDADQRVRIPLAEAGIQAVIPFRADRLHPVPLDKLSY